jgi:8-oxo-dGTP diphosphatase/2-hydroxy-dATP diphosphatase
MEYTPGKPVVTTLCLVERGDEVLLGMKKRGFGVGRWNGFGGKVQEGESLEEAARRELQEESGIIAQTLRPVGVLEFFSPDRFLIQMHVFCIADWKGEPQETEEMRPGWFPKTKLPFESMWQSDQLWMIPVLTGKNASGRVLFDEKDQIVEHTISVES